MDCDAKQRFFINTQLQLGEAAAVTSSTVSTVFRVTHDQTVETVVSIGYFRGHPTEVGC